MNLNSLNIRGIFTIIIAWSFLNFMKSFNMLFQVGLIRKILIAIFTFCRNITNMNSELFSVGKYFITRFTFVIFWSFLNTVVDFFGVIISFHKHADMIFHFGFATSVALQTFCCWLIFFETIISVKRYLHFAIFTFFRNTSGHYFYFLRKKDP